MATLTVGSGMQFSTLGAAIGASHDGDVIQVQAGTYTNDFATITTKITITGVGGMVNLVATQSPPNGKAILTTDADVTLNNIAFSGAQVPDGNGAGIRYESGNLTVNNCYFHDNQDGILGGDNPTATITINNSEFAHNGAGDGQTHNLYIGQVGTLTVDNSYFHDAVVGHEIKSRALNTIIENSRIIDGASGTASYSIDLPNGGNVVITNDVIEKGPNSQNPTIISFGEEGSILSGSSLQVTNNTILDDMSSPSSLGVYNASTASAVISGDSFFGLSAARIASGPNSQSGLTFLSAEPALNTSSNFAGGSAPPPAPPPPAPAAPPSPPASGSSSAGTSTGSTASGSSGASGVAANSAQQGDIVTDPTLPQAHNPGDIVDVRLQNNASTAQAAGEVTFGQTFADGDLPAGAHLVALVGGQQIPVQVDVKDTNADGSVRYAVLTLDAPALPANSHVDVMLARGTPSNTGAAAVQAGNIVGQGYNTTVDLTLHNSNGSTTPVHFDVGQLLEGALQSGHYTTWQQGPLANQIQFTAPVSGSLQAQFNVTAYADGRVSTDVIMSSAGSYQADADTAHTYDVSIHAGGQSVFQQNGLVQAPHTSWHQEFWSSGSSVSSAPVTQPIFDIAYLEKTGAIPTLDLSLGVTNEALNSQLSGLTAANIAPLGTGTITTAFAMTGGRSDIGELTTWEANYLATQDPRALQVMLANANAAGSMPWHYIDPATGQPVSIVNHPGASISGDGQGVDNLGTGVTNNNGVSVDTAHQPELTYVAYLTTGNPYYLSELQSQADFALLDTNPAYRGGSQGLVTATDQIRAEAWALRELADAAFATPTGDAMQSYFTNIFNNNMTNYVQNVIPSMSGAGEVQGWEAGYPDGGAESPWMEDYLATAIGQAVKQGLTQGTAVVDWMTNFEAGRYLNGANGFNPIDGSSYHLSLWNPANPNVFSGATDPGSQLYSTWAQVFQASSAAGNIDAVPNLGQFTQAEYYPMYARGALATIFNATGAVDALDAFGVLTSSISTNANADLQTNPKWNVMPQLHDGNILQANNLDVVTGSTGNTFANATSDLLIYDTGSGNDTIRGGQGVNVLFAGRGSDTLIAGAKGDYLFGGSGNDQLIGGAGNDVIVAGTGTGAMTGGGGNDTFVLHEGGGSQTITDFHAGDTISLEHYAEQSFAALKPLMAQSGSNVVISLDNGQTLMLDNQTVAGLTAGEFTFSGPVYTAQPAVTTVTASPPPPPPPPPAPSPSSGGSSGGTPVAAPPPPEPSVPPVTPPSGSGGGTASFQPGTWTDITNSHLAPVMYNGPLANELAGNTGPQSVMTAWSGGTFNAQTDSLIVWGGGHVDYHGNEVYSFNLHTQKWSMLDNPSSISGWSGTTPVLPDGTPSSEHTYEGLTFLPGTNQMFVAGSQVSETNGNGAQQSWLYNFSTNTWQQAANYSGSSVDTVSGYDTANGMVYAINNANGLARYNPGTNSWTNIGSQGIADYHMSGAIDPNDNMMVVTGSGLVQSVNLTTGAVTTQQTTGDQSAQGGNAPGLVWDPDANVFVAWNGGSTLYTLDPHTWQWSAHAAAAGSATPTAPNVNGTFGRFQYDGVDHEFVVVNDINEDVYIYKPDFGTTMGSGSSSGSSAGGGTTPSAPPTSGSGSSGGTTPSAPPTSGSGSSGNTTPSTPPPSGSSSGSGSGSTSPNTPPPPPAPTVSADGSNISAGHGGSLITTDGTWTLSSTTASGGDGIVLNGQSAAGGSAVYLLVDNSGHMFSDTSQGSWSEWLNSAWVPASDPTGGAATAYVNATFGVSSSSSGTGSTSSGGSSSGGSTAGSGGTTPTAPPPTPTPAPTLSADGTHISAGQGGSLITTDGTWTLSANTASGGNDIMLNGHAAAGGTAVYLLVDSNGHMFADNTQGAWSEWSNSAWVNASDPTGGAATAFVNATLGSSSTSSGSGSASSGGASSGGSTSTLPSSSGASGGGNANSGSPATSSGSASSSSGAPATHPSDPTLPLFHALGLDGTLGLGDTGSHVASSVSGLFSAPTPAAMPFESLSNGSAASTLSFYGQSLGGGSFDGGANGYLFGLTTTGAPTGNPAHSALLDVATTPTEATITLEHVLPTAAVHADITWSY